MPAIAIAIVTDTKTSLPSDLVERHHIYQVPQTVFFSDETLTFVTQTSALSRQNVTFENRHFLAWTKLKVFRPPGFQIIESHWTEH